MNPIDTLRTLGAIRSGEYVNPITHRRLPMPEGFRYYHARQTGAMPERVRGAAERIVAAHPKAKWIIAPKY